MSSSSALLGGFAIAERVSLLWQHSAERKMAASACTRSVPSLVMIQRRMCSYDETKELEAPGSGVD